jgi:hypothetical protein
VVTLAGGAFCVLVLLAFILDAIQLNASIPAQQRRAFLDASIKAFIKYVLACGASYWLGIRAYRMGRWRTPERATAARSTIVIGSTKSGDVAAS